MKETLKKRVSKMEGGGDGVKVDVFAKEKTC